MTSHQASPEKSELMQHVQTANSTTPAAPRAEGVGGFLRHWLTGRRGLIVAGIAVVLVGLALGWNWLTAIGVAPIILSLAPCAAMCAVGACAMMKGKSSATTADPKSTNAPGRE